MKANELRIGNYFLRNNIASQVHPSIIEDVFNGKSNIKPIPLTEEWLLKFGFIKAKFSSEYWSHYSLINGWNVALSHHTEESSGVNKGLVYWGDNYVELKYVHQLQNLYFALTGEELIIILNIEK